MNAELRKKLLETRVTIQIGKNGVTAEQIKEIKNQIEKRKLIRIKILKSAVGEKSRKEIAEDIIQKTKAELIELKGLVLSLKKR